MINAWRTIVIMVSVLAWIAAAIKMDPPYRPTVEARKRIIEKYSTTNQDVENIRAWSAANGIYAEQMPVETSINKSISDLHKRAVTTYSQVLPCIRSAWMMQERNASYFDTWRLPDDAEAHFQMLKSQTARFRQAPVHQYAGYDGPWIENIFIQKFLDKPLSYFNGFIPLFIQWIDSQILRKQYFNNIHDFLNKNLRPNVIYLAVSQGDVGLGKIGIAHPNILVLSAGGFGHVPIPLVKGEYPYVPAPADASAFKTDITFIGNVGQASRPQMFKQIKEQVSKENQTNAERAMVTLFSSNIEDWVSEMKSSRFNLAPRGYGRSSFRFAEIVQMGRVPVFLWDDVPWIPYQGTDISIEHFGLQCGLHSQAEQVVPVDAKANYLRHKHEKVKAIEKDVSLEKLVARMADLKKDIQAYGSLQRFVTSVRFHYTYDGVIHAIQEFIADPFDIRGKGSKTGLEGNYLRCTKHPREERCCDPVTSHTYADSVHPYSDEYHF